METWKSDPNKVINSEIKRHSTRKKQKLTANRHKYRMQDIAVMKEHFPTVKTVLCIGCRHDSEVTDFIDAGYDAVGIDIANETKHIRKLDAHKLTLHYDKFDFVYTSHSLEHMHDPKLVMNHIFMLKPQGVFITLPFQRRNQGSILKHATLFDIMKVDNIAVPLNEIKKSQSDYFRDMNHPVWKDFRSLGSFDLVMWRYRQQGNIKEKEIAMCMRLKR